MKPSYVYDIETQDWTMFVVGALYDGKKLEVYDWHKERQFAERLLSLKGEVYAHNGGRFDHLWLLDAAYRYGLRRHAHIIENSSGMVSLDFGHVKFLDSFRLFPMSLRRLTNGEKQSLSDLCKCGKHCGGYCAINRKMEPAIRRRVIDYLRVDVRSLWEALDHFGKLASDIGLSLGLTVGSTAWKSACDELQLPPQPYGDSRGISGLTQWRFVKDAYFGGRSEIFRSESAKGYQYDVNSMYPSKIASVELPLGYEGKRYGASASSDYRNGVPGIYRARVIVPDSFIPPLPVRTKTRIVYPTGRFDGTWTAIELAYAESVGCKIERVVEAATFARGEVIFNDWVERLFKVRAKYGKDTREGIWLKFIMNSLTGKFGARIKHRSYLLDPCFDANHCRKNECARFIEDVNGLSCSGNPATSRVWFHEYERIPACGHVEWAAYLTSAARITLHKGLTDGGRDDAVYCDTDSVFSERKRSRNVGNDLGQWQPKGGYNEFVALAPKVYRYLDASNGLQAVRAKGIPNPESGKRAGAKFWKALAKGEPIEYWSIAGIRNPQDDMFFIRRFLTRKVSRGLGGRLPGPGSTTLPPKAQDIHFD